MGPRLWKKAPGFFSTSGIYLLAWVMCAMFPLRFHFKTQAKNSNLIYPYTPLCHRRQSNPHNTIKISKIWGKFCLGAVETSHHALLKYLKPGREHKGCSQQCRSSRGWQTMPRCPIKIIKVSLFLRFFQEQGEKLTFSLKSATFLITFAVKVSLVNFNYQLQFI